MTYSNSKGLRAQNCILLNTLLFFEVNSQTNFEDSFLWSLGLSPSTNVLTTDYKGKEDKDIDEVFWGKSYNFQLPSLNTSIFQKKLF